MVSVDNLKVEFGVTPLFEDVSYVINKRDRIALVGKNGAGKSTMLKILAGLQAPTSGMVSVPKEVSIGYLPQVMILSDKHTVMEEAEMAFEHIFEMQESLEKMNQELADRTDYDSEGYHNLIEKFTHDNERFLMMGGTNYKAEIERTLIGLGFCREDFTRPTSEFSGGWRMRIELAKLLLRRPDVLLLDEPTNHLDIESIQWLENFLKVSAGAVVLVSHDRAFINNVTNRTIEISCGHIYDYKVAYDEFVVLRKERREQQLRAYENQQKQIQDTEDFIERFRYKATKAVQVQSRIKQLEKIVPIEIDDEDNSALRLKFPPAMRSGNYPVICEGVKKAYGNHVVFHDVTLTINRGEKVAFVGKNGEGKSTLVKCIMDEIPYEGKLTIGHNVQIGYFAQNQAQLLDENLTVFDTIDYVAKGDIRLKIRDILGAFMFGGEASDKKVKVLSGGERSRLAMIKLLLEPVNFLILDEPTNHLDLDMTEWLEGYLGRGNISLLMVTHDRYFLDRVCSEIIEIDNQQVYSYKGNYSYYLEKRQERIEATNAEIARANNLYRTELEWMRRMPQARGHKARYREEAFYELEKVAKQRFNDGNVKLDMKASYIGSKIFEADHLYKRFGDLKILEDFSYIFARYEKMGIVGNNGTGKSTFIKILMGEQKPDSGTLDIGETVRFGYYSQDGLKFDEQMKVIDVVQDIAEVIELGNGKKLTASQFLQHFLFTPETQHSYVYKLSGGERRRLYLCTVLMRNPNFLVLDEPTNDLDIITLQVLEEYLQNFKGCVIVVSHDRYFMDKVVDHLLVFKGQGDIRDFPGNYSDYRDWREAKEQRDKEAEKPKEEKTARVRLNDKRKMSFKEKKEFEQLEQEIAGLEQEKADIEAALCSGTLGVEELTEKSKRLPELNDLIDEKTMRWLELSEIEG